jgi:putative DNA primase/helicase
LIDFHQQLTGKTWKEAVTELGGQLDALPAVSQTEAIRKEEEETRKKERARRLWGECKPVPKGSAVDLYLTGRQLAMNAYPESLRFHPALDYWSQKEDGSFLSLGQYPAMVAAVVSALGDITATHQTYLTDEGNKANLDPSRKIRGLAKGGAIHLGEAENVLAISEGIETGLAYQLLTGIPTWAALSTSLMTAVEVPSHVRRAIICVDIEPSRAGVTAANKLGTILTSQGKAVELAIPPGSADKRDWNDFLMRTK